MKNVEVDFNDLENLYKDEISIDENGNKIIKSFNTNDNCIYCINKNTNQIYSYNKTKNKFDIEYNDKCYFSLLKSSKLLN